MTAGPEDILPTYRTVADAFARDRATSLFERPMLEALVHHAPGPRLLDLGGGTGRPLGQWLAAQGFHVTAVDGAAPMLAHYRRNVPRATCHLCDMRFLHLPQQFDVLVAWDSFFHLSHADQPRVLARLGRHAAPGAILAVSTGPSRSKAVGTVGGQPVFHASHAPLSYRAMLRAAGFSVISFKPNDPALDRHSWWLCRKAAVAPRLPVRNAY